ncbi:MAG: hypothetical protein WD023_06960 [Ilumatobacteraceae bacterium]
MSTGHGSLLTGQVSAFDAQVGLGEVRGVDGVTYLFHCIAIADGTRTIDVGTAVAFERLAKMGRYEATAIRPA